MEIKELQQLIETSKLKNLIFDGYQFDIEFESGISVTIRNNMEHDCAMWEIESNIEIEKARIEYRKQKDAEDERKREIEEYKQNVLAKLTDEERAQILTLIRKIQYENK